MNAAALQYLAGQKSIATTMKYIHLAKTDAKTRLAEIRRKRKNEKNDSYRADGEPIKTYSLRLAFI
jgi:hypothetical protein